jgi:metal transporter CNNM
MSRKTAEAAMTPLNKVFMLSSEAVLDEATLQSVLASGHSRIPVYERRNRCPAIMYVNLCHRGI